MPTHIQISQICSEPWVVQLITLVTSPQCLIFQLLSLNFFKKSNTAKFLWLYYIIKILFLNICTNLWYNKSKKNYNLFCVRVEFIINRVYFLDLNINLNELNIIAINDKVAKTITILDTVIEIASINVVCILTTYSLHSNFYVCYITFCFFFFYYCRFIVFRF